MMITLPENTRFAPFQGLAEPSFRPRVLRGYSLVELIVVVSILSALTVTMIIPQTSTIREEADSAVVAKEMSDLVAAFQQLNEDCVLTDAQIVEVDKYGLWVLFSKTHPAAGANLTEYNASSRTGWAGPYAASESPAVSITAAVATGQAAGAVSVPVIHDVYDGYYRVMMPNAGANAHTRLALVCTGQNKNLETTAVPDGAGNIVAGGDDLVARLIPLGP